MYIGGTSEETPPVSRRKIRGMKYESEHRRSKLFQVVMTRMEHFLMRSDSLGVDVEELKYFLRETDEQDIDIRHITLNARGEKYQRLFHTFSSQELSELLVVSVTRWSEHTRILVIHEQECQELSHAV